ncbi:MAG: DUF4097 family beta strand repeat-containing protein [Christensenellales bacterium]
MKALKGLLIYIGLVLGIIVGIGLILLCVMYFVPSVRIFGVGVVHYNKAISSEPIKLFDYTGYSDIEININSKKISVNVVPVEKENIEYSMKLNIFGISTEIVEYKVIKSVNVEDNKLKIYLNVSEPNGWISTSTSDLTVNIPASIEFSLLITSTSGNVSIGNSKLSTKLTNLAVTTGSGNLTLINLGTGSEEKILHLSTLNLTTSKGTFDFTSINNVVVDNKVKLVADDGVFKFKNLNASLDITGDGIRLDANNIVCDGDGLKVIAKNGYFNITKLSSPTGAENTFITDNTVLNITEVTGKTGIVTIYGDINITTLNNYTMIENTNGRVTIGTAKDIITVKTTMGNIKVDSYLKTGKFESKRGDIEVSSNSDYVDGYYSEIINEDGNIKVYNEINRLLVNTTGRSNVEVIFGRIKAGFESVEKVFQHQIITSTQGNCVVHIPTLNTVYFKFKAIGIISGEIASFENDNTYYKVEASELDQYYPNASYKDETILNASFLFNGKIELKGYSFERP